MPAPRWLKPWMVAATLGVVGIAGATTVYLLAQRQHRIDRADVIAWQEAVLPAVARAQNASGSTPVDDVRAEALAAIRAHPDIEILRLVRTRFVAALEEPDPGRARAAFDLAVEALRGLRCRVRLPDCHTIGL